MNEITSKDGIPLRVKIASVAQVQEVLRPMLIDEIMEDITAQQNVSAVLDKVYDLFLTTPFEGGWPDPDDDETDCDRAIKSDRFALMTKVRKLKERMAGAK